MDFGGFSGDSLAVFTAVSSSAAVAFAALAVAIMVSKPHPFIERLNHMLAAPLALCWLGFMAAATHLGTPANALHAVAGIGRSPLSDEVVAAVAFLFFAGVYWLYSFKIQPNPVISKVLLACSVVSAAALVGFMATAYSVPTVPSWDTWRTPANLVLTALFAGPCLAAATMQAAVFAHTRAQGELPRRVRTVQLALTAASFAFLLAGTVLLFDHAAFLGTVSNNVMTASELVPDYGAYILFHVVCGLAACALQIAAMRMPGESALAAVLHALAAAAILLAALLVRLPFYAAYLPVGF